MEKLKKKVFLVLRTTHYEVIRADSYDEIKQNFEEHDNSIEKVFEADLVKWTNFKATVTGCANGKFMVKIYPPDFKVSLKRLLGLNTFKCGKDEYIDFTNPHYSYSDPTKYMLFLNTKVIESPQRWLNTSGSYEDATKICEKINRGFPVFYEDWRFEK